jgi:hypothetical protein
MSLKYLVWSPQRVTTSLCHHGHQRKPKPQIDQLPSCITQSPSQSALMCTSAPEA